MEKEGVSKRPIGALGKLGWGWVKDLTNKVIVTAEKALPLGFNTWTPAKPFSEQLLYLALDPFQVGAVPEPNLLWYPVTWSYGEAHPVPPLPPYAILASCIHNLQI